MTSKATIRDVAKAAGVALGTASRVINKAENVAPEIRQRVQAAIDALGYQPDVLAQSMRRGETRTIGIIIRDITLPAFAAFVQSAQEELEAQNYVLMLTCSEDRPERELSLLNLLAQRRVDGLIMTGCSESDSKLLEARGQIGVPIVMLDRVAHDSSDSMLMAHADGMQKAVELLIDLGHRRIALITGSNEVHSGRDRVVGYRRAYRNKALTVDNSLVRARDFRGESGYREMTELLATDAPPTGVVAGGIAMLPGVVRAIREAGLSIPEDISVIGGGDSDLARLATPPVTVIRWDYAEVGRAAAKILIDRITGSDDSAPRQLLFPTELVVRQSCARPKLQA